ncbi:hypothetical protein [Actinoplanes sp. NPDC051411]
MKKLLTSVVAAVALAAMVSAPNALFGFTGHGHDPVSTKYVCC